MKKGLLGKIGMLSASCLLVLSCSKSPSSFGEGANAESSAFGMGGMSGFAGQESGESFTTKAPHNQVYLFAFDDSNFADKYLPSLKAQAAYLNTHPGANIMLAGHTDERGSREYNIALAERRAKTVEQILKMSGVSKQQIRVVSYGKERPAVQGHDELAHRQNRRVELIYEAIQ